MLLDVCVHHFLENFLYSLRFYTLTARVGQDDSFILLISFIIKNSHVCGLARGTGCCHGVSLDSKCEGLWHFCIQ